MQSDSLYLMVLDRHSLKLKPSETWHTAFRQACSCVSEKPSASGCVLKHMESFFRPKNFYVFTKLHGVTFVFTDPLTWNLEMFNI